MIRYTDINTGNNYLDEALAKIEEIKGEKFWHQDWDSFRVVPVEVN